MIAWWWIPILLSLGTFFGVTVGCIMAASSTAGSEEVARLREMLADEIAVNEQLVDTIEKLKTA